MPREAALGTAKRQKKKKKNLTSIREYAGLIPSPRQWVKDPALILGWWHMQLESRLLGLLISLG